MKKLEIIPQNTYSYEEGIPAYKAGEWPGSRPSHFSSSKLILKPIQNPEKPFKLGHCVHFPQKYSEEYKFIPHRKQLCPLNHDDIYKPSKRCIIPKYSEPKIYYRSISRRPPEQMNSDFIAPLFQKKYRISQGLGNNSKEWRIESKMNRKKRLLSLDERRNEMFHCNPGDKNYKNVDNSTDFFKEGGLIVGSTNRMNYNKTTRRGEDNFYQTLDLNVKVLNDNKIWENKLTKENFDSDKDYVLNLNHWEENNFDTDNKNKKENEKNDKKK